MCFSSPEAPRVHQDSKWLVLLVPKARELFGAQDVYLCRPNQTEAGNTWKRQNLPTFWFEDWEERCWLSDFACSLPISACLFRSGIFKVLECENMWDVIFWWPATPSTLGHGCCPVFFALKAFQTSKSCVARLAFEALPPRVMNLVNKPLGMWHRTFTAHRMWEPHNVISILSYPSNIPKP